MSFLNPFDFESKNAQKIKDRELLEAAKKNQTSITMKEFWALCKAQYSIILPWLLFINLMFFLLLLFMTKVWWA